MYVYGVDLRIGSTHWSSSQVGVKAEGRGRLGHFCPPSSITTPTGSLLPSPISGGEGVRGVFLVGLSGISAGWGRDGSLGLLSCLLPATLHTLLTGNSQGFRPAWEQPIHVHPPKGSSEPHRSSASLFPRQRPASECPRAATFRVALPHPVPGYHSQSTARCANSAAVPGAERSTACFSWKSLVIC